MLHGKRQTGLSPIKEYGSRGAKKKPLFGFINSVKVVGTEEEEEGGFESGGFIFKGGKIDELRG